MDLAGHWDDAVDMFWDALGTIPGLGLLIEYILNKLYGEAWDPMNKMRDIAIDDYQSAQDHYGNAFVLSKDDVSSYDKTFDYLSNYWQGQAEGDLCIYLISKVNNVEENLLNEIGYALAKKAFTKIIGDMIKEILGGSIPGALDIFFKYLERNVDFKKVSELEEEYNTKKDNWNSLISYNLNERLTSGALYTLELASYTK